MKTLNTQSTVTVDAAEFGEVVKAMEAEGLVRVVGDHQRRVLRKVQTA